MTVDRQSQSHSHTQRWVSISSAAIPALALLLAAVPARAQEERLSAPSLPDSASDEAPPTQDRVQTLEERITELGDRIREAEEARQKAVSPLSWNGYVDFGYFVPLGNRGVGWIRDAGNVQFPQYAGYSWTFLGDILGTAINTRGEVADLGDAPDAPRFDSVNSDGASSFINKGVNGRWRDVLSAADCANYEARALANLGPACAHWLATGEIRALAAA